MRHLTEAVRTSVHQRNWYAALGFALALPDICGALENPSAKSGARHAAWWDQYVGPEYRGFGGLQSDEMVLRGALASTTARHVGD